MKSTRVWKRTAAVRSRWVEREVALGITYEMRDGRIGHVRVYVGHERALDAARSGG
jgi:hypothetical protein